MKITGTSNVLSSSFTASRPELAVGKLNVGEDKTRVFVLGQCDGFRMRAGDAPEPRGPDFLPGPARSMAISARLSMIRMFVAISPGELLAAFVNQMLADPSWR